MLDIYAASYILNETTMEKTEIRYEVEPCKRKSSFQAFLNLVRI